MITMACSMGIRTVPCELIDPAVVVQQQIFARVQIGDLLVAVVELKAGLRKLLCQLRDLVLHLGVDGRLPSWRISAVFVHLVFGPSSLSMCALITLPMP